MDTVTVNGKVYTKAGKAADGVGYASDYVGQLCRKGVLDAIMLGKTWYVQEESLLIHKQSQPRINTAVTRRDIERQKTTAAKQTLTPISTEYRKRLLEASIRYLPDTDDLLSAPTIKVPEDTEALSQPEDTTPPQHPADADGVLTDEYPREDDNVEEKDKEIPVPIRILAPVSPDRAALVETRTRSRLKRPLLEAQDNEFRQLQPHRSIITYRSLLPLASVVILLFILANVTLESTWTYTNDRSNTSTSKQTHLKTAYAIASVSSILQVLQQSRLYGSKK